MVIQSYSLLLPRHHMLLWVFMCVRKCFQILSLPTAHCDASVRPTDLLIDLIRGIPSSSLTAKSHFVLVTNANIIRPYRPPSSNFISKAHAGPRSSQPQFRKTRSSQPRLKLTCACITMTTVITGTTQRRRAFRALFFYTPRTEI